MRLSTSTQLILLLGFSVTLNFWSLVSLTLIMVGLLLLFLYQENKHFYRLMKRLKWFYIVMFGIMLFNTPGEHIPHWPFAFNPSYEGLTKGLTQVLRIASILGALSIILIKNTNQQLISGLYFLMKPLTFVGVNTARFSARLWLTLHYVELRNENSQDILFPKDLAGSLDQVLSEPDDNLAEIELEQTSLGWIDYIALVCMLIVVIIAVYGLRI